MAKLQRRNLDPVAMGTSAPAAGRAGKKSRVQQRYAGLGQPVQKKAEGATAPDAVQAGDQGEQSIAGQGLRGASQPLPHLATLQTAFGAHSLSDVRAEVGGSAAVANRQLGSQAYAHAGAVAFATTPDLGVAAHEAAHVVQQRGGSGAATTGHEAQADSVAEAVVRGVSAEPLLDHMVGTAGPSAVQGFNSTEGTIGGDEGSSSGGSYSTSEGTIGGSGGGYSSSSGSIAPSDTPDTTIAALEYQAPGNGAFEGAHASAKGSAGSDYLDDNPYYGPQTRAEGDRARQLADYGQGPGGVLNPGDATAGPHGKGPASGVEEEKDFHPDSVVFQLPCGQLVNVNVKDGEISAPFEANFFKLPPDQQSLLGAPPEGLDGGEVLIPLGPGYGIRLGGKLNLGLSASVVSAAKYKLIPFLAFQHGKGVEVSVSAGAQVKGEVGGEIFGGPYVGVPGIYMYGELFGSIGASSKLEGFLTGSAQFNPGGDEVYSASGLHLQGQIELKLQAGARGGIKLLRKDLMVEEWVLAESVIGRGTLALDVTHDGSGTSYQPLVEWQWNWPPEVGSMTTRPMTEEEKQNHGGVAAGGSGAPPSYEVPIYRPPGQGSGGAGPGEDDGSGGPRRPSGYGGSGGSGGAPAL